MWAGRTGISRLIPKSLLPPRGRIARLWAARVASRYAFEASHEGVCRPRLRGLCLRRWAEGVVGEREGVKHGWTPARWAADGTHMGDSHCVAIEEVSVGDARGG